MIKGLNDWTHVYGIRVRYIDGAKQFHTFQTQFKVPISREAATELRDALDTAPNVYDRRLYTTPCFGKHI